MKKFLAILMSTMILFSLSACGSNTGKEAGDSTKPKTTADEKQNTATYERGTIEDNVWQSEFFNMKYTASDDMSYRTDDELYEMMKVGMDQLTIDEKTGKKMVDAAKVAVIYEMMATNDTTGSNVIVAYEKLKTSSVTEEKYITAFKAQLPSMGINADFEDIAEVEIAGQKFTQLKYSYTTSGMNISQALLLKKYDDHMLEITLTLTTDAAYDDLLAGFSKLK